MTATLTTVIGARPQFVKAAPVSRAVARCEGLVERIVHTGQHFDDRMSDAFFEELDLPRPSHHLGIHGGSHGEMTGRMLQSLDALLREERPDMVLVYGDTNSTLAGALAAAKLDIPVAHVEAGLRCGNRRMPEEINRIATDHVSTMLFCPTGAALRNLDREGLRTGVFKVGDVMYDSFLAVRDRVGSRSGILAELGLDAGGYALCTIHRAGNVDDASRLRSLFAYLRTAAGGHAMIMPVHPRTRQRLDALDIETRPLRLVEPVGYLDMQCLLANAREVFTDSGGVQKEAYFHRVPCVTLRDETEWVETLEAGWNRLWTGPDYAPRRTIEDYGDGDAAGAIVDILRGRLLGTPTPSYRRS